MIEECYLPTGTEDLVPVPNRSAAALEVCFALKLLDHTLRGEKELLSIFFIFFSYLPIGFLAPVKNQQRHFPTPRLQRKESQHHSSVAQLPWLLRRMQWLAWLLQLHAAGTVPRDSVPTLSHNSGEFITPLWCFNTAEGLKPVFFWLAS